VALRADELHHALTVFYVDDLLLFNGRLAARVREAVL
jgi:hypothetical protein